MAERIVSRVGQRPRSGVRASHAGPRSEYQTLRETLMDWVAVPLKRLRGAADGGQLEEFWALRDIDLRIDPGETVALRSDQSASRRSTTPIGLESRLPAVPPQAKR